MNSILFPSKKKLEDPTLLKEWHTALETIAKAQEGDPTEEPAVSRKEIDNARKIINHTLKLMRSHNSELRQLNNCLRIESRCRKLFKEA